jgi:hypothetical protein
MFHDQLAADSQAGSALPDPRRPAAASARTFAAPPRRSAERPSAMPKGHAGSSGHFGTIGKIPRVTDKAPSRFAARFPWLIRFGRSRIAAVRLLHAFADEPRSAFSQAIRILLDELRSRSDGRRLKALLVTSDMPGAGKTTIAINLARAAAGSGDRTLLIDANPARPKLGELVSSDSDAGLIELAGTLRPFYRIGAEALFIVPIMAGEDKIVRRLLRQTSIERLTGIASNFDFVVIDGPSIATDETSHLVAGAVDQVVLVMPAMMPRASIDVVLDRLDLPRWKFRGVILSMVDPLA